MPMRFRPAQAGVAMGRFVIATLTGR